MSCQKAKKYIQQVATQAIPACNYIRLACQRHLDDLVHAPEKGWYFEEKSAKKVFDFLKLVYHTPDKRKYVPFECEPWQAAIIYIIFGWKKANGRRRFTKAYTEIAKKNGKTTFAAAIANYMLIFDGEKEAEIYCAASVEKQSMICFDKAKEMLNRSPALKQRTSRMRKSIVFQSTMSKVAPLGRDSDGIEGINPHCAIIDEYHVWKNNDVLDNITSAMGNRLQPLVFIITTAGRDKTLPCFEYRNTCVDILEGNKKSDDTFVFIFTIDDPEKWKDESEWVKANPNLNISVDMDRFKSQFNEALLRTSEEVNFKTKNLNLWVNAPEVWISDEKVKQNNHGTSMEDLTGQICYGGLDLASHVDVNSFSLYFPDVNGRPVFKTWYWIPQDKVQERADKVDYLKWHREGWIYVFDGNVIDIDRMVDDIAIILEKYNCKALGYDPYKAYHGVIQGLQGWGLEDILFEYHQGIKNMSEPTKELERIIYKGEADLMNDPVKYWMFRNVVISKDTNDNIKVDKKKSRDKIDGVVTDIIAIGCSMATPEDQQEYILPLRTF
ncbi:MAG: terminase large subunit [Prolixibacteraceae bacterium]